MKISGSTRIFGIFGDPVEQSLSPAMHNRAFEVLGLDMVFVPFLIRAGDLDAAVRSLRALDIQGISVTIPHKESIIEYLDELDEDAARLGAVNTIVNDGGRLVGYNTDGEGFLKSLVDETDLEVEGKRIVIMGAGGAARGILATLLMKGPASVVIANRTLPRAATVCDEFREKFPGAELKPIELTEELLRPCIRTADLIINTTPVGMKTEGVETTLPLPLGEVPETAVVSDIVYCPPETRFIKEARDRGLKVHKGLGMLTRQGALAFKLWTGSDAPYEEMKKAALEIVSAKR